MLISRFSPIAHEQLRHEMGQAQAGSGGTFEKRSACGENRNAVLEFSEVEIEDFP